MKFLFFDIECSNCFDGVGKICEFGYVITDENFNVLFKDTIPMSPGRDGRFNLTGRKHQDDIELAWDENFYFSQPEFPHFYNKIKNLLVGDETICFAFDYTNDLSFLYTTLRRYKLEPFDFVCYDVQEIASRYSNKQKTNLKQTYIDLVGKGHIASFQEHLSRDDALMTAEILDAVCVLNNTDFNNLDKKYKFERIQFIKYYNDRVDSEHLDKDAKSNMDEDESNQFKDFVLKLTELAHANKDSETPNVVSDVDAYRAYYIVHNIKIEKDGDALLFLTSLALLNTYVKQDNHSPLVDYSFKNCLEVLLQKSKHVFFRTIKMHYIDRELGGNNLFIVEFCDSYQFSYHSVKKHFKNLIVKEYKQKLKYWDIKNKSFINELFQKVYLNNIGFSNLTMNGEDLREKVTEFSEDLIKNPSKINELVSLNKKHKHTKKEKTEGQLLWDDYYKEYVDVLKNEGSKGKRYTMSGVIKEDVNLTRNVINKMKELNIIPSDPITSSDFFVVLDEADKQRILESLRYPYNGEFILLDDFLKN